MSLIIADFDDVTNSRHFVRIVFMSISNEILRLGIDVGSTTVKVVVTKADTKEILFTKYERHHAEQWKTAQGLFGLIAEKFPDVKFRAAICGSGGKPIADRLGIHYVQEVVANSAAVRALYPAARTAIELGGDSTETFKTTLDWIVKNKIETVTSHILTPYPGTKVYEELKKADRITSTDFSKYNTAHVVFKPQNISAEELYEGYLWIYRNVYSLKNILKRLPDCKEQRAAYLTFNLFYRKYGKFTDFLCKIISYKLVGKIAQLAGRYL